MYGGVLTVKHEFFLVFFLFILVNIGRKNLLMIRTDAKNRQKNTAHYVYTDRSNVRRREINRITSRAQHSRGGAGGLVGERRRI